MMTLEMLKELELIISDIQSRLPEFPLRIAEIVESGKRLNRHDESTLKIFIRRMTSLIAEITEHRGLFSSEKINGVLFDSNINSAIDALRRELRRAVVLSQKNREAWNKEPFKYPWDK